MRKLHASPPLQLAGTLAFCFAENPLCASLSVSWYALVWSHIAWANFSIAESLYAR